MMVDMDMLDRLKLLANLPPGSTLPPELFPNGARFNSWASAISQLCGEAAAEIEFLRGKLGYLSENAKVTLREEYEEAIAAREAMEGL